MKQETPKRRRWTNCFNLHLQWRNKIRQNLIRTWMRQFWKGILFSKITKALWLSSQTTEAEQGLIKALGIHLKKKTKKSVLPSRWGIFSSSANAETEVLVFGLQGVYCNLNIKLYLCDPCTLRSTEKEKYWRQRRIQNPIKHLRWGDLREWLTI